MAESEEDSSKKIREALNHNKRIEDLEAKLKMLSESVTKLQGRPRKGFRGIDGYKYTAEDIGRKFGISTERLHELAETGYAPHMISKEGDVYFKLPEISKWIKDNLYRSSEGKDLPFKIGVYSTGRVVELPDTPVGRLVPKEISDVPGLNEFLYKDFPPCVYFLIKEGKVVYVGQTMNLPNRLGGHQSDKEFDRVLYLTVPKSDLIRVEGEFIRALNPPLNGSRGVMDNSRKTI